VVEAVGEGVTSCKVGDRVYVSRTISGAYAQKTLVEPANVYPLPDNIDFDGGAALGVPYGTAYRALFHRGGAQPAEDGARARRDRRGRHRGGADGAGARVRRDRHRRERARADARSSSRAPATSSTITTRRTSRRSADVTQGRGVDLILEMLANVNLAKDLTLLAKYGRVVVVGSRGKIEIDPRDTMSRDADIRGMTLMNATPAELAATHAAIRAGLENGTLRPIIEERLPLAEAAKALAEVLEGNSHGKIVLVP
jgi:NADPH2:quinone reductase